MQTLLLKLILLESEALRFNRGRKIFWWLQGANSQKRLRTTDVSSSLQWIELDFYVWSMQIRMVLTYFLHVVYSLFFQNKFTHREPLCMFVPRIVMRFPVKQTSTTIKTKNTIARTFAIKTCIHHFAWRRLLLIAPRGRKGFYAILFITYERILWRQTTKHFSFQLSFIVLLDYTAASTQS